MFKLYFVKNELTFICFFSESPQPIILKEEGKKRTIIRSNNKIGNTRKCIFIESTIKPKLLNVLLNGIKDSNTSFKLFKSFALKIIKDVLVNIKNIILDVIEFKLIFIFWALKR